MFETSQLLLFLFATLALIAAPGPAVVFLVATGVSQGRKVGALTAAGIALGNLGHAMMAAFGASAILASSDMAFAVLKYLGAAYLIYLGVMKFVAKPAASVGELKKTGNRRSILAQGMMVGLLNPKVALFLLAFLPQFADPSKGAVWLQLLILGLAFVFLGWIGDTSYALLSGTLGGWINKRKGAPQFGRYLSGTVFCILGLVTALSD